jgi:hypothetical protein
MGHAIDKYNPDLDVYYLYGGIEEWERTKQK